MFRSFFESRREKTPQPSENNSSGAPRPSTDEASSPSPTLINAVLNSSPSRPFFYSTNSNAPKRKPSPLQQTQKISLDDAKDPDVDSQVKEEGEGKRRSPTNKLNKG